MRTLLQMTVAMVLATTLAGCGEESAPAPRAEDTVQVAASPAGGGTIEARVTYSGSPDVQTIRVNKDVEQCGREGRIEKVVVGPDHGLADAVISISGPTVATPQAAVTPTLDQKGCEFHPRVLAVVPGEVDIQNSDGILHNIHTYSTANPPFNKAQPRFKKVMTEQFEKPEFVRVECDVHSWMQGWIAVMPTPLFGVTDDGGRTMIQHVPAGKHTVEIWHPVLGKQTEAVEVTAGQTTKVMFEFAAAATAAPAAAAR